MWQRRKSVWPQQRTILTRNQRSIRAEVRRMNDVLEKCSWFFPVIDTTTTASERVKSRLEQLDAFEVWFSFGFFIESFIGSFLIQGGQQTQSLTQQEYINRINDMNKEMVQAWKNDQRVKTLKIAIQVYRIRFLRYRHLTSFSWIFFSVRNC